MFDMEDSSPPGSPLSSLSSSLSDGFDLEEMRPVAESFVARPAKRQKTDGTASMRATPSIQPDIIAGSISSDSSGDVPPDPSLLRPEDDDPIHEQVTICQWVGCKAGDLGNMDRLVDHIHNEHIETRLKKYTCEWSDCSRISMPHASGYALKAHMRSHTREKPFYCALPECDRAFTRSDALAKHMRTVHETEALRPSDPIPKSMQPLNKSSKLKITLKTPQSMAAQLQGTESSANGTPTTEDRATSSYYPADLGLTTEEEAMGAEALWRLLRRQLHWSQEDSDALKREVEVMEEIRMKEWKEKEVLLQQVIDNEKNWHARRQEVLGNQGIARIQTAEEIRAAASEAARVKLLADTSEPTIMEDEPQGDMSLDIATPIGAS